MLDTRGLTGCSDKGLGIGECGVMGVCGAGTAGWDVPQWGSESRGADGSVVLQQLRTVCLSATQDFLRALKGSADSWLGLRRRGKRLLWVDGSSFKEM